MFFYDNIQNIYLSLCILFQITYSKDERSVGAFEYILKG